jgi:hypothetical protein
MFAMVHVHSMGAPGVAWAVLFAFILAQLVNYGARIVYYRRNA